MNRFVGMILLCGLLVGGCGGEKPKQEKQDTTSAVGKIDTSEQTPPSAEPTTKENPKGSPDAKAKPALERNVTINGEVVDVVSYATTGTMGNSPAGKEIIEAGAKGGHPLGVWERSTGQVYLVTMKKANTSANSALLPFVGTGVTVKGDVYRKGDQRLLVMSVIGKSAE